MRVRIACAAVLLLSAAPVLAQSTEVTGPWTLTKSMVTCTDLPAAVKPVPRIVIFAPFGADARFTTTRGDVVIKRFPDDGLAVGQHYVSQRIVPDAKKFPRPGEGFGDLRVTGYLTISALDEVNAMAHVDFACDSIDNGDFLEPFVEPELPTTASAPVAPDFSDRGSVLFGADNRAIFGDGDVVSIDRGTVHGVLQGARYAIYRDLRNGMPLVYIAEVVVMSTNELTSKVIVTKALDSVATGDIAVPRRAP